MAFLYMSGDRIEYDHPPHSQGLSIQKRADYVTIYIVSLDNLMETDSMCRYLNELGSLRQSQ